MPYRLLLADDSLTIQKVVELTFPDPDYELLAVGNGDKAMEALDGFRPDIVLADVVMPGPPGYDICEALRKRPEGRFTPVVLLTGTFEPFDRARADRVGATAVVTKPFDSHALASLVRDLLQKAAEERATAESAPPPPPAETAPAPVPAEAAPAQEAAAADLFGGEAEEPEELYATSAIPIERVSSVFTPPPPAVAPPPPPEAMELESVPEEAAPPPPPPPPQEALAFEEEPLPPPPPFEADARSAAAWELADAPAAEWEVPPPAEPPAPISPLRAQETTQPLPSRAPEEAIAFEEEPAAPPAEAAAGPLDVHSASTPTAIINPPHERTELPEPPLYAREPEPPAIEEPNASTAKIPTLAPEPEPALEELPSPEEEPGEDVFAAEPPPEAPRPPEPPDLGGPEEVAVVARDIDEDIAAFESGEHPEPPPAAELEAIAAGSSLAELIPPAVPEKAASREMTPEEIDKVARRVAELIGERVIRDVAWEVVPELAERLVRQRLAEIEKD